MYKCIDYLESVCNLHVYLLLFSFLKNTFIGKYKKRNHSEYV